MDKSQWALGKCLMRVDAVVVLGFYIPPTAEVIGRWDLSLKSHQKDWRSLESNP